MNSKKLYVFDFDDTLVYNHLVDFKSFEEVIKKKGIKKITQGKLLELRKEGMLAEDIFRYLAKGNVEKLVAERKKLLAGNEIWNYLRLNNGVKKTLEEIKKQRNSVVIATKKSKNLVICILSDLKIDKYIDEIYTTKEKYDLVKNLIAEKYYDQVIFVSDSEDDILPMKKLKIKIYCFYNEYREKENLGENIKVIKSMDEIL